MTPGLLQRVAGAIAPPAAPAPTHRLDLIMPEQDSVSPAPELRGGESYSFDLIPGFLNRPVWPTETWVLSSFQVQLSGTLVTEDGEFVEEIRALDIVLSLQHNSQTRWSTNLSLPLIPVPASTKEFTFATGVFVDLQNPLRYEGGAHLAFIVSGIVPRLKP